MRPSPDQWLDGGLVVSCGCLGLLFGFFAMMIASAQAGLGLGWIFILSILGGVTGGLSAWVIYRQGLARRSRTVRMIWLVIFLVLLAMVLPAPFHYELIRT